MSFMAAALPFLRAGGGYLLKKLGPTLGAGLTGWLTNSLGGDEKSKQLGKTSMDHLVERGANSALGMVGKFANSAWLNRKMPILAPALGNAANELKTRLAAGYA